MNNYPAPEISPDVVEDMQLGLFGDDSLIAVPVTPLRPLQYLGAKGRAIATILAQAETLNPAQQPVLDAFSGSSVVSQAFAQAGYPVVANDAMTFCAGIARTFLGIGQRQDTPDTLASALAFLRNHRAPNENLWDELQVREAALLNRADAQQLSAFYLQVPVVWRPATTESPLEIFFRYLRTRTSQTATPDAGLVAAYYAGTYFGVRQAVELDCLRHGIEWLALNNRISDWQRNLLLTALTATLSAAVHSAGKHFAQPINIGNADRADILFKRLLQDRNVDVYATFDHQARKLAAALQSPVNAGLPHRVLNQPLETLTPGLLPDIGLLYADPPYTAQQYSRFYHVPEVVYNYVYPALQQVNGTVTTGLYPADKFKSDFCSKSKAAHSFRRLFELSRELNANLLISYSVSLSGKTGNDRMISLDEIYELGGYYFGANSATTNQLNFAYRQLNAGASAVTQRQDKEILLSFVSRDK